MSAPVVWQPLRDVLAEAIYTDPADAGADEHWPNRLDFPRWEELSEEKRENWRRDADRVIARLASPVGCTPRMEKAALDMGAVDWLAASPAEVLARMFEAEMIASIDAQVKGGTK